MKSELKKNIKNLTCMNVIMEQLEILLRNNPKLLDDMGGDNKNSTVEVSTHKLEEEEIVFHQFVNAQAGLTKVLEFFLEQHKSILASPLSEVDRKDSRLTRLKTMFGMKGSM